MAGIFKAIGKGLDAICLLAEAAEHSVQEIRLDQQVDSKVATISRQSTVAKEFSKAVKDLSKAMNGLNEEEQAALNSMFSDLGMPQINIIINQQ